MTTSNVSAQNAFMRPYTFTSESVSEGHPDKVADRISDAVVDAMFAKALEKGDINATRVACETMVTTDLVVLAGETRGNIEGLDFEKIARD